MFIFRSIFITAVTAFTLLASEVPYASAAPWAPWHFVMAEDGSVSAAAGPSAGAVSQSLPYISDPPTVEPTPIIDASPTDVSPDATNVDLFSTSAISSSPTSVSTDSASPQVNGGASLRALGGTGALFGSTAAVLYLIL
ncbi:hypothetical protein B0H21DRAFT_464979 [Amylocystis lapponica]|nr:hypothetical protein B0H21DRAFT_464979 [Amylocystis lapponica]